MNNENDYRNTVLASCDNHYNYTTTPGATTSGVVATGTGTK